MSQIQLFNDTWHIRNQQLPTWAVVGDLLYWDNTGWHLRTSVTQPINGYVAVLDAWTDTWVICISNGMTTWKWWYAPWVVVYEDTTNPSKTTNASWGKRIWVIKWGSWGLLWNYEWDSFFIDCFDNNEWDAANWLSVNNWTTVFGQDVWAAWDPAKLLSGREIPMDGHNIDLEASNWRRTTFDWANGNMNVWGAFLTQTDSNWISNRNVHIMLWLWAWALHMHHNPDVYKNPWDGEYAQIFWFNSDLDWFRTYSKISWANRQYFSQDYLNNKTYLNQATFWWIPLVDDSNDEILTVNMSNWQLKRMKIWSSYWFIWLSSWQITSADYSWTNGSVNFYSKTLNSGTFILWTPKPWYKWQVIGNYQIWMNSNDSRTYMCEHYSYAIIPWIGSLWEDKNSISPSISWLPSIWATVNNQTFMFFLTAPSFTVDVLVQVSTWSSTMTHTCDVNYWYVQISAIEVPL